MVKNMYKMPPKAELIPVEKNRFMLELNKSYKIRDDKNIKDKISQDSPIFLLVSLKETEDESGELFLVPVLPVERQNKKDNWLNFIDKDSGSEILVEIASFANSVNKKDEREVCQDILGINSIAVYEIFADLEGLFVSIIERKKSEIFKAYTDGACKGNPGPGGYGAIILQDDKIIKKLSGNREDTTNNRMELLAVIKVLEWLERDSKVEIYTDSNYVLKGIKSWLANWTNNGWKTSGGKEVKNKDLWERIAVLQERHQIDMFKVKGHSGDEFNNRADQLARDAIE